MESSTLRNTDPDDRRNRVSIPVRPDAVIRARETVRRASVRAGVSTDRVDDLVIAVSEACTNALEAQLAAAVTTPIEVTCTNEDDVFEVSVRDHGAGFEPRSLPVRPPLEDARHLDVERGWGIQLMRQLVDELVFDATEGGMCVRLRVQL